MEVHHKQVEKGVATHLLDQVQRAIGVCVRCVGFVAGADVLSPFWVKGAVLHQCDDLLTLIRSPFDLALPVVGRDQLGCEVIITLEEDLHCDVLVPRLVVGQPGVSKRPAAEVLLGRKRLHCRELPDLWRGQVPPVRVNTPQELLQLILAVENMTGHELCLQGMASASRELRVATGSEDRGVVVVVRKYFDLGELLRHVLAANRAARHHKREECRHGKARNPRHVS
mmetsp:Transcript_53664/g.143808  ORF Transcript_53664/g.143808 Transcript_53664/m.143808 type:complete len:226 (-) Transcript_53664:48-725(-)